ncbi:hypothetical protein Taro_008286 [Colocasia esculenta]|uniref:Uncharacterized protein n=1 Tax=Colocasia esculenta TaxID=4460 RepID=A0A843TTB7_COLES|nr:hypothetical protein [Colocasia esculenta]
MSLRKATLELETTSIAAQEKIQRIEYEVARLRDLLGDATRELDEAHHALLLLDRGQSRLLFQNGDGGPVVTPRPTPNNGLILGGQFSMLEALEDNHAANSAKTLVSGVSLLSSSLSSEESNVELLELVSVEKFLEKGRLLEAAMKVGPLPQWRFPPPLLWSIEIPPSPKLTTPMV